MRKIFLPIFLIIFICFSNETHSQKKNENSEKRLKDWIVYFLDSLEQIENKIIFLTKEIRSIENESINFSKIKEEYNSIKTFIEQLSASNTKFLNSISKEQKFLIKRQIDILNESFNTLEKLFFTIEKIAKNKEEIFNKTKEIEKTIKTIHRQYLAIEFILLEKAISVIKFS